MFLLVVDCLFDYKDSKRDITKDLKNARKKFGELYKLSALKSIRFG